MSTPPVDEASQDSPDNSSPDSSHTTWTSHSLASTGALGEELGTGTLATVYAAATSYRVAETTYVFLLAESGAYDVVCVNADGTLGEVVTSGALPAFCPAMLSYTLHDHVYWLGQTSDGKWTSRELREDGSISEVVAQGTLPFACSTLACFPLNDALHAVGPNADGRGLALVALYEGGTLGHVHERAWTSDEHLFAFEQEGESYLLALMDGRFYSFGTSPENKDLYLCAYDSLALTGGDADATLASACVSSIGSRVFVFAQETGGAFVVLELIEGGRRWAEACRGVSQTPYDRVLIIPRENGAVLLGLSTGTPPPTLAIGESAAGARAPHAAATLGVSQGTVRKITRISYEIRELRAEGTSGDISATGALAGEPAHILTFAAGSPFPNAVLIVHVDDTYTICELARGRIGRKLASGSLGANIPVLLTFVAGEDAYVLGHRTDGSWLVRPLRLSGLGDEIASGSLDAYYPVLALFASDTGAIGQRDDGTWTVWSLTSDGLSGPTASGTLGSFHQCMVPFGFFGAEKSAGFCLVHGASSKLDTYELSESGLGERVASVDLGERADVILPYTLGRSDATLLYTHSSSGAWTVRELIPPRPQRGAPWFERDGATLPWLAEVSAAGSRGTQAKAALVLPTWPRPNLLEVSVVRDQPITAWILQGVDTSGAPQDGAATGDLFGTYAAALPLNVTDGPKLFAHKETGEWTLYDLASGSSVGTALATGHLHAFYPSLFTYTVGGAQYLFGQRVDGSYATWRIAADGSLGAETATGELPYFCPRMFPCIIDGAPFGMGLRQTEGGVLLFRLASDGVVGEAERKSSDPDALIYPFTAGGTQFVLSSSSFEVSISKIDSATHDLVRIGGASRDDTHDSFVALDLGEETLLLGQRLNGDWRTYSLSADGSTLTEVAKGTCGSFYRSMYAVRTSTSTAFFALSPRGAPPPLRSLPAGGTWMTAALQGSASADTTKLVALPSHFTHISMFRGDHALTHSADGSYAVHRVLALTLGSAVDEGSFDAHYSTLLFFDSDRHLFGHRDDGSWFIRSTVGASIGPVVGSGAFDRSYHTVLDASYSSRPLLIGFTDDQRWTLWSVEESLNKKTLAERWSGTLDASYVNFLVYRNDAGTGLRSLFLGQRADGTYQVWQLRLDSRTPEVWELHPSYEGSLGGFYPNIQGLHSTVGNDYYADRVFAQGADGSYIVRSVYPGHPTKLSGKFERYFPTIFAYYAQSHGPFRVLASAPDPSPPGVLWFSQRLMPNGTASETAARGGFGAARPALLPFMIASSSYMLIHEESGRYRTHMLDAAGNLGVERATGRLPHYYPTMCTFSMRGRTYWLGQREDGVYSVRPLLASGALGKEKSKGALPFACTTLFVYAAGGKLLCFGYDEERTLLAEVWSSCTLGPAKLGIGAKGSRPFTQDGKQYFVTPVYKTYTPSSDGTGWDFVASESLQTPLTGAFAAVSAGERLFLLWQTEWGSLRVIEIFDGGRRWSDLAWGSCQRVYDEFLGIELAGLPFVLGISTQGTCMPLSLNVRVDDLEYPRPATSTIPVLDPPAAPSYTNLTAEWLPVDVLEAGRAALEALANNPATEAGDSQLYAALAERYGKEIAGRSASLSRGLILGGSRYIALPPMQVSFARGLIIQMWIRPLRLVDNASLFELSDPTDWKKTILLRSMADGSVELVWRNQAGTPRAVVMNVLRLRENRWNLLLIGFGPDAALCAADGNRCNTDYLTSVERKELDNILRFDHPSEDVWAHRQVSFYTTRSQRTEMLPFEGERVLGSIGKGVINGPANLNIGEIRLWNYFDYRDEALKLSNRHLRGDEPGLVGYWCPQDFQLRVKDYSPFARHGHLVGAREEGPFPAPREAHHQSRVALHVPSGARGVELDGSLPAFSGGGFTWQASFRFEAHVGTRYLLILWQPGGSSRTDIDLRVLLGSDSRSPLVVQWTFKDDTGLTIDDLATSEFDTSLSLGEWVHIALVFDARGECTAFVNGERQICRSRVSLKPWRVSQALSMDASSMKVGHSLGGYMSEVRFWDRALSDELVKATSGRRIHKWAPNLIAYLRLDEDPLLGARRPPWVSGLDRTASANGGTFVAQEGPSLAPAPSVASAAVFSSERGFAQLRGDFTLPGGASGFSLQLWLCARDADQAALLKLTNDREPGQPTRLAITWAPDRSLNVTLRDAHGHERSVASPTGLIVDEWVHLTITADRDGVVCIYRDGILVTRETIHPYAPAPANMIELGADRRFTELRFWRKTLTQAEVMASWRLRLPAAQGLAQRLALDSNPVDFAGSPTEERVIFREDPSLDWGEPPTTRPTITAASELVSETVDLRGVDPLDSTTYEHLPTEVTSSPTWRLWTLQAAERRTDRYERPQAYQELLSESRPQIRLSYLAIELTAKDERKRFLPNTELTFVLSKPATLFRDTGRPENQIRIPRDNTCTLKTNAMGRARLLLKVEDLTAPIFSIRHDGMGVGEWVLVTPDQVLHDVLGSLSPEELRSGKRASQTRKGTGVGLVDNVEHSEKLARMLRTMLGCAAAATYELQSTEALAFGLEDDDTSSPVTPLYTESGAGIHVELPEHMVLVRRIGRPLSVRPPAEDDDLSPQSFGFFDDIGDFFEDCGEMIVETVEEVVDHIAVAIDTAIDGIQVAFDAVVKTVEDMAGAVWNVMKIIGKTIMEVMNFLCGLFDFSDFMETSDYLLDHLRGAIGAARRTSSSILSAGKELVGTFEDTLLSALGETSSQEARTPELFAPFDIDYGGPLGFILGHVASVFEPLLEELSRAMEPLLERLKACDSKVRDLQRRVVAHLANSDLASRLNDLTTIADGDPLAFIVGLTRDVVRLVTALLEDAIDIAIFVLDTLFEVLENVLFTRLDVPVLSWLFETLTGRALTVARLVSLLIAVPLTLGYKLLTGSSDGPFADASIASFGSSDAQEKAANIATRSIDIFLKLVSCYQDVNIAFISSFPSWRDLPNARTHLLIKHLATSVSDVVFQNPHVADALGTRDFDGMDDTVKTLTYASWCSMCAKQICDAIAIAQGTGAKKITYASDAFGAMNTGCAFAAQLADGQPTERNDKPLTSQLSDYDTWAEGAYSVASSLARGGEAFVNPVLGLYAAGAALSMAALVDVATSD